MAPMSGSLITFMASLMDTATSPLLNAITEKSVRTARKGQEARVLLLLALLLMIEVLEKEATITERWYNKMDNMDKFKQSFKQCPP